jgi:tRNA U38,U39,U40 pseudouridine synthase TruA
VSASVQNTAQAFAEAQIRRAVLECTDVLEMRRLTLQALDLLKNQRKVFDELMRQPLT